jgi:peptidyl-prolyl cis-trans isomerase A (cyclophilin A)
MEQALPRVAVITELGTIELELEAERAPVTVANFLRYIDEGYYDGGVFYRTVTMDNQPDNLIKIEVIQGGLGLDHITEEGKAKYPPIPIERTSQTGLKHLNGTLSMARIGADSATSEFFICINDQPELDFGGKRNPDGQGFAAFGRVVSGEEVVQKIQQCPAQAQSLSPAIKIITIERLP